MSMDTPALQHAYSLCVIFACTLQLYIVLVAVISCPIAIAYSMGQVLKSVCVCQSVSLCICPSASTLTVAFLDRFSPKLAQT